MKTCGKASVDIDTGYVFCYNKPFKGSFSTYFLGSSMVEHPAVKICSFHEKSWLKNRVNSGKPKFRESGTW
jgi:hypothetical protein